MSLIERQLTQNGLVFAFLVVGVIILISHLLSDKVFGRKIPGTAIAIVLGLVLATFGGDRGIADVPVFSGLALLGGSMMRDFSVVATAMGASISEIRRAGLLGVFSLFLGVTVAFFSGGAIGYAMGYTDAKSFATIGAGACTFIVGPITGSAIGASSDVIAISIAIGVVKSIVVTIGTPVMARFIGLNNPQSAMAFGGLIGTTSGVAAGLAATDPHLVPYGALTATFYTGLGALLCPSLFFLIVQLFLVG